jgi:flavin-dependent dehydrogenase
MQMDVVIVGGGAAGCYAALNLSLRCCAAQTGL